MNILSQYRIPFSGLKPGKHEFEFDVEKSFFDEFEYSLVKDGRLNVQAELTKEETFMILSLRIEGSLDLTCDVCLSRFPAPTTMEERVIVKFDDDPSLEEQSEEIMVLGRKETDLDLSTLIYETINLAVPHYSRCDEQGENRECDPAMLDRLNQLKNDAEDQEDKADPRWDILKNIKNN